MIIGVTLTDTNLCDCETITRKIYNTSIYSVSKSITNVDFSKQVGTVTLLYVTPNFFNATDMPGTLVKLSRKGYKNIRGKNSSIYTVLAPI